MNIALNWLETLLRWGHVIAGIAWVGTSFYFNWFDLSARKAREKVARENVRGTLHEVHGGNFYYHEQYWPETEAPGMLAHSGAAQLTFLSGFALLLLIYWLGASIYLIDPSVRALTPAAAIGISAGSIIVAWLAYHFLCGAAANDALVFLGMTLLTAFAAWFFGQVFGARAACVHVGVILGSIMAANVQFIIVPNHIAMHRQLRAGAPLDRNCGALAKRRSRHNNYFALPVVFSMLAIHFPLAYTHRYAWAILTLIMLAGAALRHQRNVLHLGPGKGFPWLIAGGACLAAAIALTFTPAPAARTTAAAPSLAPDAEQVFAIVRTHCASCHSARPASEIFPVAPLGFMLDTPDQLKAGAEKVLQRTVLTHDMPINNATGMTERERELLGAWLSAAGPGGQGP